MKKSLTMAAVAALAMGIQFGGSMLSAQSAPTATDHYLNCSSDQAQPKKWCITFFPAGIGKVGMRNNCANDMVAVLSADSKVLRYRVGGFKELVIDAPGLVTTLIGEEPPR
jgi:hypothetical protein